MVISYWCIGCVKKNEEGSYSGEGRRLIWWCDRGAQAVQAIVVVKTIWIDITIIIDIVLAAENIIISYKNDLLQQHLFIVNSRQHLPRHLPILHKDIRGTLIIILIIIVYLLHLILSTRNTSLYSIHCTHTHDIFHTTHDDDNACIRYLSNKKEKKSCSLTNHHYTSLSPVSFICSNLMFFLFFYHEYNLLQAPACI